MAVDAAEVRSQSPKSCRSLVRLFLVGFSYLLTGLLGLEFYPTSGFATLIWPPSAIAIVAAVLWGPGMWPAIYVGALTTNLFASAPWPVAAGIAAGNTLEALVAFVLLRRCGFDRRLGEVRSALALILAGALGSGVSATIGVSSLRIGGIVLAGQFADTWFVWWFGDMASIVVLAPLLFLAGSNLRVIKQWNPVEFGLLSALSAVLLLLLFGDVIVPPGIPFPSMFLLFPCIIWAALRFGTLGSALTIGIVAFVAIVATVSGHGPYASVEPSRGILILQLFMTVGAMTGLIVAADSDQRRRAEAGLRARSTDLEQTKAWLQTALEAGNIAVWEWDLKTGEVLRTEGQNRLFGNRQPLSTWNYDQFLGVVHPDDRPRIAELAKEIRLGKTPVVKGEFRSIWPDLSVHWYLLRGRIYLDDAHRLDRALGVFVDISRERDLELELGEVLLSREEISHDLKNPLHAILMNAEVLRRSSARSLGEEFVQMRLHGITHAANRMRSLIEAILDVTRIRGGHLVLDKKPHDLRSIVDEVVEVHLPLAESRDVRLDVACDTGRLVVCDRGRISQVLSNLVANAIQHSPGGETVRIQGREDGDEVRVAVSNIGPVIPPEHIPYVFERYWRGRASPGEGTGLGLFISRGILEAHGRKIEVTSEPGAGTTFRFTLQAAHPDAAAGRAA